MNKKTMLVSYAAIAAAIAVIINLFVSALADRTNLKLDLTQSGLYSVSEEAKKIITSAGKDINVYCFVEDVSKPGVIAEYTKRFCAVSDRLIYKSVNPKKHPELTNKYPGGEIAANTVVFDSGTSYRIIKYEDMMSVNYLTGQNNLLTAEEKFSAAVRALSEDISAKTAFLTGHGETFDEKLLKRISDEGINCSEIDLRSGNISDCDAVFIISPKSDYTAAETDMLAEFLKNDGMLTVCLDASSPQCDNLERLLSEWGVRTERNMIYSADSKSIMGNQPYGIIGRLNSHPVTDNLIKSNIRPVFFATRGITVLWEAKNGITTTVLANSDESAEAVSLDTNETNADGEIPLLTLSRGERGKLIAIGSSMFFSDELKAYNGELIRNILTWGTEGGLSVNIAPKTVSSANINVPKSDIILYTFIFGAIIPLLIAAAGITVAVRRRRK